MRFYRIAKSAYTNDLTGTGARLYGGRWNHKGISAIYTSESRALATAEYLVHVPMSLVPKNLSLVTIEVADKVNIEKVDIESLPQYWRSYPSPSVLADYGSQWIHQNRSLILRVPSVVVAGDFNALINPAHQDIEFVKIHSTATYELDRRLLRMP